MVNGSGGGPDKTILNSPRYLAAGGYRMICAYMHAPTDPGFEQLRAKLSSARRHSSPFMIGDRGIGRSSSKCWMSAERNACKFGMATITRATHWACCSDAFGPCGLSPRSTAGCSRARRTPLYYWIDRVCLPRYELVICVSPDLQDRCLASGVPKSRCVLIENGVDTKEYSRPSDVRAAKKKLGLNPERFLIGAVGRLSAEKGFDILIRAVDQLLRRGVDLELAIVGEGDEKSNLQNLIAELGHSEHIHLLGYWSDMPAAYGAMDVFALSSLREGLPNVLLEAMAMEVPVVATRIAGVPRLIQSEQNGLLVQPGSIQELTEGLVRLLDDAHLRVRLARLAGRQWTPATASLDECGRFRRFMTTCWAGTACNQTFTLISVLPIRGKMFTHQLLRIE